MNSNQHTPAGGPRLVTKLCVVGEAGEEDGAGGSFLYFLRANVPHTTSDQTYPLFPDDHVQLRSSHLAALTPSGSLSLSAQPSPLILEAAKRLRIPTSSSVSSSASSSRPPGVQIAVQDFAVSLLTEGTGVASTSSHGGPSQHRLSSSGGAASRRNSFSPVLGGDHESTMWIVVLEIAVPCATLPPLDCYSISLPLPRCLSNTLRFQLTPLSATDDGYFNIATTPRLLSSPEVPSEELALEGTFQSTPSLEIRWAKSGEASLLDASSSSTGGKSKMVTVRGASPRISYTVVQPTDSPKESSGSATEVEVELSSTAEVHFSGVESSVFLDVQLDVATTQPFEWIDLPYATTNVGLVSFDLLDSGHATTEADPDVSTGSTIQSPPSPSPSTKTPAYLSANPSKPSPGSTSQLSLLRQQLPSMNDTSDLSFAFDQSGSPSPRTSPSMRNRSPLSRSDAATSDNNQYAKNIRLHLDLSKVRQHVQIEPFSFSVRGTLRLRDQQQEQERAVETFLPLLRVLGEEPPSTYVVKVDVSAVAGMKVVPPRSADPIVAADGLSKSAGGGEGAWDLRLEDANEPVFFKLAHPAPPPLPASATSCSPNYRTIKARRQSTPSPFFLAAQNLFSAPATGSSDPPAPVGSSRDETISKVELDVVLVPRLISALASTSKGKGKGKAVEPPLEWDQLTRMRLLVPPRSRPFPTTEGGQEVDLEDEDTLEFGVIATGSTTLPALRILSASVQGRPLAFEISDPDEGAESEEAPGVVGYVKLLGEEGMRERGGEIEVCFVLDSAAGAASTGKGTQREIVLGLPSFEGVVGWEEVKVTISSDYSLTSRLSSALIATTPNATSILRTLAHSLPSLHAPHLHLLITPSPPSHIARTSHRPSFFSLSNLPLVILSILLFSMGTEIRTLRSGLVDMVVATQTEALATREAIGRCEAAVVLAQTRIPSPFLAPAATTTSRDEVLRPTFTEIFPSPPPPPVYNRPGPREGEVSPFRVVRGLNQLHQWAGKVDEALERNVFGRGAKRLGGLVGRVWGWVVWG